MTECLSSRDPACPSPARYALRDLDLVGDLGVESSPFWPACEGHAATARAEGCWHIRTLQPPEVAQANNKETP